MPPALPNDQELSLKKRARRRLVGAIALVLLMVIVLPMVLEDRAHLVPQEAIKVSMPDAKDVMVEMNASQPIVDTPAEKPDLAAPTEVQNEPQHIALPEALVKSEPQVKLSTEPKSSEVQKIEATVEKKAEASEKVVKVEQPKPVETKVADVLPELKAEKKQPEKNKLNFAIQIGVYSDLTNVERLETKLKEAGYSFRKERIATATGVKIRLRAGSYHSRQEAADALNKLKSSGISGMVVSL